MESSVLPLPESGFLLPFPFKAKELGSLDALEAETVRLRMSAGDFQVFGRMLKEAQELSERGRGRWQGCQWVTLLQYYKGSLCNPQSKHLL